MLFGWVDAMSEQTVTSVDTVTMRDETNRTVRLGAGDRRKLQSKNAG